MNTGIEKINVSVLIFTLNEEINLPFCLESLDWCDDINVVDSFSNDKTEVIARKYGARF
jgi:glycosyltransferase involved in cell wall biosynthesis